MITTKKCLFTYLVGIFFVIGLIFSQSCKKNEADQPVILSKDNVLRNFSIVTPIGGEQPLLSHIESNTIFIYSNFSLRNNKEIVVAFNTNAKAQVYLNGELVTHLTDADSVYNISLAVPFIDKTHSINYSLSIKSESGDSASYTIIIGYIPRENNTLSNFALKVSYPTLFLDVKDSLINIIVNEISPSPTITITFSKDESASIYIGDTVLTSNELSFDTTNPYSSVLLNVHSEKGEVKKYRITFNIGIDASKVFPDVALQYWLKSGISDLFYQNLFLEHSPKVLITEALFFIGFRSPCIKSIVGIERFTNLKSLSISYEEVTSLSPLNSIEQLTSFSYNTDKTIKISNIDALFNHKNLQTLNLAGQNLSDASLINITQLTNLKKIDLWENPISNVGLSYIASIQGLESLNIGKTNVTDLSSLTTLSLKTLNCSYLDLSNFPLVENMTSLEYLDMSYLSARSPSAVNLNNLKHLKSISCGTWIQTAIAMNELEELETVDLSKGYYDPFVSLDLSKAAKLSTLSLYLKGLADLNVNVNAPLKSLTINDYAACFPTLKQLVINSGVSYIIIISKDGDLVSWTPYDRYEYFILCPN